MYALLKDFLCRVSFVKPTVRLNLICFYASQFIAIRMKSSEHHQCDHIPLVLNLSTMMCVGYRRVERSLRALEHALSDVPKSRGRNPGGGVVGRGSGADSGHGEDGVPRRRAGVSRQAGDACRGSRLCQVARRPAVLVQEH